MISNPRAKSCSKMKKERKFSYSMKIISFATLLLFAFLATPAFAEKPEYGFHFTIKTATDTLVFKGESEFTATPSFYSINMIEDNGRCVIHMLNFTSPPGPGTYDVEKTEVVRTAIICVLENADPRERLASHSGTFTITEITNDYINGHFDVILKGPLSGKEFHLTGQVISENIPTNIRFK